MGDGEREGDCWLPLHFLEACCSGTLQQPQRPLPPGTCCHTPQEGFRKCLHFPRSQANAKTLGKCPGRSPRPQFLQPARMCHGWSSLSHFGCVPSGPKSKNPRKWCATWGSWGADRGGQAGGWLGRQVLQLYSDRALNLCAGQAGQHGAQGELSTRELVPHTSQRPGSLPVKSDGSQPQGCEAGQLMKLPPHLQPPGLGSGHTAQAWHE